MKKKHCIIALVCLLCLGICAFVLLRVFGNTPAEPTLPPISPVLEQASQGLNSYTVILKLDADARTLSITEEIACSNPTGDSLSSLVVRLWPNAFAAEDTSPAATDELYASAYPEGFSPGSVLLHDVKWNGEAAAYRYLDDAKTVLEIPVDALAPGEEGKLYIRCVVQLPNCAYRTGYTGDTWMLGNVLPILSIYENGAWRQDPYTPIGDPFYSECANYAITLHLPKGYIPVCSVPLAETESGIWQGEGLALRDVGLCVSPGYKKATALAGNTKVTAYARDEQSAKAALSYARKALEIYETLYGEYPYPLYSVCSASFAPGAMEYPCMAVVDEAYFAENKRDTLELIIAHETAHQWFYALVGSDSVNQPWQDEALCEYALLRYVERQYGMEAFNNLRYYRADAPMMERIPGGLTPATPIDSFSSLADYRTIVYGRGASLLLALDMFVPGGADAFLKSYAAEYAFNIAGRTDFENSLNAFARKDVSPLVQDYLDTKMNE